MVAVGQSGAQFRRSLASPILIPVNSIVGADRLAHASKYTQLGGTEGRSLENEQAPPAPTSKG